MYCIYTFRYMRGHVTEKKSVQGFPSEIYTILKGWLTVFFLGLIVFMGCSLECVHACFFKKHIIFHIIYLYSTPLCPFSDKRLNLFPGFMKLLLQKYAMGWDWLAGSVCCDSLNRLYCTSERPAPQLSSMLLGWIVNSGVVYNAYQFEPIETQRILVKRIVQNLCKHGS